MEILLLLGSGLAGGACAWFVLMPTRRQAIYKRDVHHIAQSILRTFNHWGACIPVEVLDAFSFWPTAADELVRLAREKSWPLERTSALVIVAAMPLAFALIGAGISFSWMGLPIGFAVGIFAYATWYSARAKKRTRQLAEQVPDVFRSLSGALASGKTLAQAISYVGASGEGPLYREFGRASLRVSCGSSATDALSELPERVEAPGVSLMVTALSVSAKTGAALQGLFSRAARLVERRFELERELSAKTAQVRLSARIVSALPAAMVCLLTLLSPDYREGIAEPLGTFCVVAAATLDIAALIAIRRLMKGVV